MYQSFEELEVWKRSCQVAVEVYAVLDGNKDYSLKDQMQRAAISISSNIAEGAERGSNKDFIRFLHIAKGSASELRSRLYIANKIQIINCDQRRQLCNELIEISKMIHDLIKSLKT